MNWVGLNWVGLDMSREDGDLAGWMDGGWVVCCWVLFVDEMVRGGLGETRERERLERWDV